MSSHERVPDKHIRIFQVLISASYGGHTINLDPDFQFGKTEKSEDFLKKFPLGRVPALELKVRIHIGMIDI